ncbi:flagellar export protein FliJ [Pueribacillus sp. YX66]|uniref:flagellar export protein FliJ n=1 Tax=Pueribacillus sp. YX66 TaxID=3229242 RepID=UPI00358D4206
MASHFRLDKVLKIREKEKDLSEIEFANAQQRFESVARTLYELLKKKEELEKQHEYNMRVGVQADTIRQYNLHLQSLQNSIMEQQMIVNHARFEMEQKRNLIVHKSVEVKKYNLLKDKHIENVLSKMKKEENNQLDELSILKLGERYGV